MFFGRSNPLNGRRVKGTKVIGKKTLIGLRAEMRTVTACTSRDRSSVLWLSIYKLVLRHLLPMVREPDSVRTFLGANASQLRLLRPGSGSGRVSRLSCIIQIFFWN